MRDARVMDERGFSDGWKMRVDYWTVFGRFKADSVRKSTLIQFASGFPRSCVRFSTLMPWASENPRSCRGHPGHIDFPAALPPVRRGPGAPYGYTLQDSTRFAPVGASKETAYAHHLNRSARCRCRAAGSRHYLPRLCRRALRVRARTRLGRLRVAPHRLGRSPAVPGVRRREQGLRHWL